MGARSGSSEFDRTVSLESTYRFDRGTRFFPSTDSKPSTLRDTTFQLTTTVPIVIVTMISMMDWTPTKSTESLNTKKTSSSRFAARERKSMAMMTFFVLRFENNHVVHRQIAAVAVLHSSMSQSNLSVN